MQLVADYPTLVHLYQTDGNAALDTCIKYLMFLIFSSIKHFNSNIVDKMANIGGTSSTPGLVLRRLTHNDHEFKCNPNY